MHKTYKHNEKDYSVTMSGLKIKDFAKLAPMMGSIENETVSFEDQIAFIEVGVEILNKRISILMCEGEQIELDILEDAINMDLVSSILTDLFEASTVKGDKEKK